MDISIDNETNSRIVKKNILELVEFGSKKIKLKISDLSIAFVNDDRMTEVNEQYLQHEGTTDIITFDYTEDKSAGIEGELVICVDQAKRQAREYKVELANELARLVFHGLLHLGGYDDITDELQKKMTEMENELLSTWFTNAKK